MSECPESPWKRESSTNDVQSSFLMIERSAQSQKTQDVTLGEKTESGLVRRWTSGASPFELLCCATRSAFILADFPEPRLCTSGELYRRHGRLTPHISFPRYDEVLCQCSSRRAVAEALGATTGSETPLDML